MDLSDDIQKKYGFLLQPIKDLTKNWEIDVTHVLEEYMDDLEKMTVSIDNGKTVLNFAEASLLIQGTACVWSRKVEYLHVLVRQTLDMIANRQKEKSKQNADNSSSDQTEDPNFDGEDEKLLKLDDITVTSQRELAGNYDPITPIPITPVAMLENDTDERGRVILSENKNESVCYTNDFWENRFIPFGNKMSVLDKDTCGMLDEIIIPSLEDLENAPMNIFSQTAVDGAAGPSDCDVDENANDDDGGMDTVEDNGVDDDPFVENIENDETVVQQQMQLRPRFPANKPVAFEPVDQLPSVLDPYTEQTSQSWIPKSFQKRNSHRIPASMMKKSKKRKLTPPSPKKVEVISEYIAAGLRGKGKSWDNKNPLSKFVEIEQKKMAQMWRILKKEAVEAGNPDLGIPGEEIDEDGVFDDQQEDVNNHYFSTHADTGTCSPDLDDLIGDVADNQGQGPGDDICSSIPESYEDLVRHHVELFYSAARRFKEETALAQRVKVWDEAITPRLAEQGLRPEFDIHKYGGMVLKKFENPQESKFFKDIVESTDSWFICRLFAATLQLVNDNNFEISKHEDFTKSVNTMKLTLMSKHRLCERFEDYASQS